MRISAPLDVMLVLRTPNDCVQKLCGLRFASPILSIDFFNTAFNQFSQLINAHAGAC